MADARFIDLAGLPHLDADAVRMLWVNDWYDGPIEAVVEVRGAPALMVLHDEDVLGAEGEWRWVAFALTPEAFAEESRWQQLFVRHVSAGWDFTGAAHPPPTGDTAAFYAPYEARAPRDLAALVPIGWLSEVPGG